jgi:hypothetical protein
MQSLPLGGIANKLTVYCNESGQYVTYLSDKYGFSNPRGMWSRDIDIAIVGDSFVHGACVPEKDSFAGLIRQHYPATMNLGNDGIGPLLELRIVKEYLPALRPKLVIWSYFEGNDVHDLSKEKYTIARHYLGDNFTQDLIKQQPDIDREIMAYLESAIRSRNFTAQLVSFSNVLRDPLSHGSIWQRIIKLSYLSDAVRAAFVLMSGQEPGLLRDVPYNPPMSEEESELFGRILREATATIHSWGGRMVFVYLPQYERYDPTVRKGQSDREKILDIVRSLNVPVVDLHETFERLQDPLEIFPFRLPTHYNKLGYELVAKAIVRSLDQSGRKL